MSGNILQILIMYNTLHKIVKIILSCIIYVGEIIMKLLTAIKKVLPVENESSHLKLLYSSIHPEVREEVVYRKNGKSVDKIIEFDLNTGSNVKTTHYDYFNDKKISSVDEFDRNTGKKIRTINYVLYKSVDEYDLETGKKLRTINFNVKDDTKISSIQEYDSETGKIVTISIYKRDGKTVSIIKKIDPITEKVTSWVNDKNLEYKPIEPAKVMTRCYDNIKIPDKKEKENIAQLIDNLYSNKIKFENI